MPRRSNQFRRLPSQLVAVVTRPSGACSMTTTTAAAFGQEDGTSIVAAGHLFASGRPRSRWRSRSAGLL
jgi:hypothetical protein